MCVLSLCLFVCLRAFTLAANGCRLANHSLPPGRLSWHRQTDNDVSTLQTRVPTRACFVYVFGDGFGQMKTLFFTTLYPGQRYRDRAWVWLWLWVWVWVLVVVVLLLCLSAVGLSLSLTLPSYLSLFLTSSLSLSVWVWL